MASDQEVQKGEAERNREIDRKAPARRKPYRDVRAWFHTRALSGTHLRYRTSCALHPKT